MFKLIFLVLFTLPPLGLTTPFNLTTESPPRIDCSKDSGTAIPWDIRVGSFFLEDFI